MGQKRLRTTELEYRGIWYRHTGDDIPPENSDRLPHRLTNEDILEELGENFITHMIVRCVPFPDFSQVAPKLTHLTLCDLLEESFLLRLNTLTELKSLDLSYSSFYQGLPSSISQLRSLESLNLSNCHLRDLPPWLNTFTRLKELNLSENSLSDGLPEVVSQLNLLESLELSFCSLTGLPTTLKALTRLKVLNLSANPLSDGLPEVVSQLNLLESLNLCYCELTGLPATLNTLTKLKELDLSRNSFTDGLPEVVSQLNLLESLNLRHCKLTGLPATLNTRTRLKELDLSYNSFSDGLLEVISHFNSLESLNLSHCELTGLPAIVGKLKMLKNLNLSFNEIDKLPPVVGELKELVTLDISFNNKLIALSSQILSLSNLRDLWLIGCDSLQNPPENVAQQGCSAIQQYYKDLAGGKEKMMSATVAVIGKSRSGKTSLIKTMQNGSRILTENLSSPERISTKVFNFEKVSFDERSLYFTDFGGQEIYHHAYRLTLRENCIPVIVVNMHMFVEESNKVGPKESVRALFFDWMAHLYIAHPNMLPPALVLTHKDLLDEEKFEAGKTKLLQYCNEVRDEIRDEENRLEEANFCRIKSFGADTDLFTPEWIFEVGREYSDEFTRLRDQLLEQSQRYVMEVPRLWKQVEDVKSTLKSDFTTFESLLDKVHESHGVVKKQLEVIIKYMHLSGKLLWYNDIEGLDQHVFHKISAVTDLLNVLYDHDGDSKWDKRRENFKSFKVQNVTLVEEEFEESVSQFKAKGVISLVLLAYLIKTETAFTKDDEQRVALTILSEFRILFGSLLPVDSKFIVPHFAQGFQSTLPTTKLDLQFQTDILCKGLALPQYAFHELTVRLLELYSDPYNTPVVKHNGVSIAVDNSQVHFTHDAKAGKITASVAFNVEEFHKAWNYLKDIVNVAIKHLREIWRATPLVCIFYCAHCSLTGQQHPEKVVNPSWSLLSRAQPDPRERKMRSIVCTGESVSSVFKFPKDEKRKLKEYVSAKQTATASVSGIIQPYTTPSCSSAFNGSPDLIGLSFVDVCKAISDGSPTHTNKTEIKDLFDNTDVAST
ncbi:malignant fibrous histiocytoma-amplified sequence 1-like [Watersipora subatra]|uniref:malignant fibrous histiocytoma-amplified sequence 1-like n=1 Tax=Watersipora subatra TaxID=2589382 RepID=UPI00355C46F3